MAFRVGQKVICVDMHLLDADSRWRRCEVQPQNGTVYTIRGYPSPDYDAESGPPLYYLEEIRNTPVLWNSGFHELAWPHRCFRPITDISIFERMLKEKVIDLEPAR